MFLSCKNRQIIADGNHGNHCILIRLPRTCQNSPFKSKNRKIFWGGGTAPPKTLSPVGRGQPCPHPTPSRHAATCPCPLLEKIPRVGAHARNVATFQCRVCVALRANEQTEILAKKYVEAPLCGAAVCRLCSPRSSTSATCYTCRPPTVCSV